MESFKQDNLEILCEQGVKNKLTWKGISDNRDPYKSLNTYFTEILPGLRGKEVEIDFTSLSYMNSSTVTPIIQLIRDLNAQGSRTTVFYSRSSHWQLASFKALETIATMMENIKIVAR